jgi:hypothetical protein
MGRSFAWTGQLTFGVTLIAVGLLLLARNYLGAPIANWWAVFILVPAAGAFWAAWITWRETGLAYAAAGPFTGGLFFLAVALIFLLELEWGRIWPIFLLIAGFGALLPAVVGRRRDRRHRDERVTT